MTQKSRSIPDHARKLGRNYLPRSAASTHRPQLIEFPLLKDSLIIECQIRYKSLNKIEYENKFFTFANPSVNPYISRSPFPTFLEFLKLVCRLSRARLNTYDLDIFDQMVKGGKFISKTF
jgi:hypothetical protein